MADRIDAAARSRNMSRIRSKGMKPEMAVRRMAHRLGYRFRLHRRDLPGTPDLVFPSRRKIIFVHGCFWHRHADPSCNAAHTPRSNEAYWEAKIARNIARDAAARAELERTGWSVLELWECHIRDAQATEKIIRDFLGQTGSPDYRDANASVRLAKPKSS